jgi:hypothetical protein
MAGFERSFLNDLLIGKKNTIRESSFPALSTVLDCDPDYLSGALDTPRRVKSKPMTSDQDVEATLSGICEAGAWREEDFAMPVFGPMPIEADPRYAASDQSFYLVRGDHAAGLGVYDGSVVCIVDAAAVEDTGRSLHDGQVVLVRRSDGSGRYELTVRVIEETRDGKRLSAKPGSGSIPPVVPGDEVQILGLLLRAIRVFGTPV